MYPERRELRERGHGKSADLREFMVIEDIEHPTLSLRTLYGRQSVVPFIPRERRRTYGRNCDPRGGGDKLGFAGTPRAYIPNPPVINMALGR